MQSGRRGWRGIAAVLAVLAWAIVVAGLAVLLTGQPTKPKPSVPVQAAVIVKTVTATAAPVLPTATSLPSPTAAPSPTAQPVPAATSVVQPPTSPTAAPVSPTPIPDPVTQGFIAAPPTEGRWIDFNLSDGFTRLMEGRTIVKQLPSAWGFGTPGSADDYFATVPGRYTVYTRYDYLWYDYQYSQKWVQSFVGFDPARANGFHSFLLDEQGKVIDDRLGNVSHGCIRVEEWKAVYDFAAIGMPVIVHGGVQPDIIEKKGQQ